MTKHKLDLVIRGGRIIDPETGRDEIADVGIVEGAITTIGTIDRSAASTQIDASGKIVCPGFVDLHAHGQTVASDWMQACDGVTTALELEVGVLPVGAWYDQQMAHGRVLNYGASASWLSARKQVMASIAPDARKHPIEMMGEGADNRGGWSTDVAAPATVREICAIVEAGVMEGGIGIGIPQGYAAGSGVKEMTELCRLAARCGVPTFNHVLYMSNVDPQSSEEAYIRIIGYAAATGAHMHICHLNSTSLLDIARCRELLLRAQATGLPITVEAYPYGTGSTVIAASFFASPDFSARTGSAYDSIELVHNRRHIADRGDLLASARDNPSALVAWHFLGSEDDRLNEELLDLSVLYPGGAIASDAMPWVDTDGTIYRGNEWPMPKRLSSHPRSAGTFTKFLGDYYRQRRKIGLVDAIAKCTILPSRILEKAVTRMRHKARIQEGCDADIVVFDPEEVASRSTFEDMTARAAGIEAVLVGGVPVIRNGELDPTVRPGRPLRREMTTSG